MKTETQEIEVRFLEVNPEDLKRRLRTLGAEDIGEDHLKDILFYHSNPTFSESFKRFVRIRQTKTGAKLTFKHQFEHSATGTKEIEFGIDNVKKAQLFLEEQGWYFSRFVEKKRHSFILQNVEVDIDLFPQVPPFVELEGESEESLKKVAKLLGFDWHSVELRNSRVFLKEIYHIPLDDLKYFTFERFE